MGSSRLRVFSKLDLDSDFHQVLDRPDDESKTAFVTKESQFSWHVLKFGLTNAPVTFQKLMKIDIRTFLDIFYLVYLDDILIYVRNRASTFTLVITLLRKNLLSAIRKECVFLPSHILALRT